MHFNILEWADNHYKIFDQMSYILARQKIKIKLDNLLLTHFYNDLLYKSTKTIFDQSNLKHLNSNIQAVRLYPKSFQSI